MLPHDTLYGTPSKLEILDIKKSPAKEISIPIVQGNKIQNVKVRSITIPLNVRSNLLDDKIGVILNTDANNGTVNYELWSLSKKIKQKMLFTDKAGEE